MLLAVTRIYKHKMFKVSSITISVNLQSFLYASLPISIICGVDLFEVRLFPQIEFFIFNTS